MSLRSPLSIEWTEPTFVDISGISDYLLAQGVASESVEAYVTRIFKAAEYLATLPGAGKPGRVSNTREWHVKNTPYALVYRISADRVQVLRVMHHRRHYPEQ